QSPAPRCRSRPPNWWRRSASPCGRHRNRRSHRPPPATGQAMPTSRRTTQRWSIASSSAKADDNAMPRTLHVIIAAALALGATTAHAEEPFYQGKRLTLLINFAPGGPTDVEGRLLAKHIAKH